MTWILNKALLHSAISAMGYNWLLIDPESKSQWLTFTSKNLLVILYQLVFIQDIKLYGIFRSKKLFNNIKPKITHAMQNV